MTCAPADCHYRTNLWRCCTPRRGTVTFSSCCRLQALYRLLHTVMHYVVNKKTWFWDLNGVYICEQLSVLDNGNFREFFVEQGNFSLSKWEFPVALDGATRRWKSLIVKLAVLIHQRDKQTDTARQQRPRALWVASRGKIYEFSHYVVLIVCFCYTLLINDCLVWSIIGK